MGDKMKLTYALAFVLFIFVLFAVSVYGTTYYIYEFDDYNSDDSPKQQGISANTAAYFIPDYDYWTPPREWVTGPAKMIEKGKDEWRYHGPWWRKTKTDLSNWEYELLKLHNENEKKYRDDFHYDDEWWDYWEDRGYRRCKDECEWD